MNYPATFLLPAVGPIVYETPTLDDWAFVAQTLAKRGEISVTIPAEVGANQGAKPTFVVFDVEANLWKRTGFENHPEARIALSQAVDWFNKQSAALTRVHQSVASRPLPYDVAGEQLFPIPALQPREHWKRLDAWLVEQLAVKAARNPPDPVKRWMFAKVAAFLAAQPRPAAIRVSLSDEEFEGSHVLHMIVAKTPFQPQVIVEAGLEKILIDYDRKVSPERHRQDIVLSHALALVSGFGLFLKDPHTRFLIAVQSGDPHTEFPSSVEAEISVGGNDFFEILSAIEASPADKLMSLPGITVTGQL